MTLPQPVQDAVDSADNDCGLELTYLTRDEWQTIRAHLLSQEAEIDRLQHDLSDADERSALRSRERTEAVMRAELAESRLAAANALPRDIAGCQWFNREAPATVELINAHLQGAGNEA